MELIDIANLAVMPEEQLLESLPEIIPNSELQFDGDIACYVQSWPDQALSTDVENLKRHIEVKRLLAACEKVIVHTTRGDKAGRDDIATLRKYQESRSVSDPAKKARVEALRAFLHDYNTDTVEAAPQWEIEADDSMSIRQRELIAQGRISKIMTVDKDLDMVPGIHIDYNTYDEKVHPDGYGKLWIVETGELVSKGGKGIDRKLKGDGTGFFFAQLLMGDTADSVPGLPILTGELMNKYKPTKGMEKHVHCLQNPKSTARARSTAKKAIEERKPSGIGPMLAYAVLKDCTTNKQAFTRVKEAYAKYYGEKHKFTSWRGDKLTLSSGAMLLEQARLLWMLRTRNDDVLEFFKTI